LTDADSITAAKKVLSIFLSLPAAAKGQKKKKNKIKKMPPPLPPSPPPIQTHWFAFF
jgi:hypothetical protein